jgi:cytidylate kinase
MHDLINDIVERDKKDRTRELSPLIKTEDSILLDSTDLDQGSILDEALKHIKKRNIL